MKKILGMGNALVDVMTQLDNDEILSRLSIPKGSMQLVDEHIAKQLLDYTAELPHKRTSGGSAANTMHGIANLGTSCAYIGTTGNDDLAVAFLNNLKDSGVEPKLTYANQATGNSIVLISKDSERTMITCLGAAIQLSPEMITDQLFTGYDIFHIEGYLVQNHDLLLKAVETAKAHGMFVSLDMASYNVVEANHDFLQFILKDYIDVVFANEQEAKAMTGGNPREALKILSDICDIAVVKIGSAGSLVKSGTEQHTIGIIPCTPIDTTGAGDLYAAGFLHGLAKGAPLEACGRIGALLAGNVIEVIGAQIPHDRWNSIRTQTTEMLYGAVL